MRSALTAAFCVVLSKIALAQHWPTSRGPQAAGVADGRPTAVSWDGVIFLRGRHHLSAVGAARVNPIVAVRYQ